MMRGRKTGGYGTGGDGGEGEGVLGSGATVPGEGVDRNPQEQKESAPTEGERKGEARRLVGGIWIRM